MSHVDVANERVYNLFRKWEFKILGKLRNLVSLIEGMVVQGTRHSAIGD
jgi:hypothetical protein